MILTMVSVILPRAEVAAERVEEVITCPTSINDPASPKLPAANAPRGELTFRDVSFQYPDARADVISGVNFTTHAGQMLGIIGSTGSGKSTLLHCLSGMDRPSGGSVLLGDTDLAALDERELSALRLSRFGFVFQQAHLLSTLCLLDNIVLPGFLASLRPRQEVEARGRRLMERMGISELAGNDITAGVSQSMMIYTPIAQGITTNDDSEFAFTDLLTTGDNAYSMENYATAETAQKADTDPEGCFTVAVAADNSATGARVVWVNCPNLLESNINQAVSGGNAQFLGSVVNWMNGEQTTAVINAKSMSAASLSVPTSAAIPLGVLFTLVLPIVCIIAGAVVCVVRRRR
mgnify:CR=1 FL=1